MILKTWSMILKTKTNESNVGSFINWLELLFEGGVGGVNNDLQHLLFLFEETKYFIINTHKLQDFAASTIIKGYNCI